MTGDLLVEGWLAPRALGRLRWLARICLGLGAWIAVLFALAAVGQLHRPAVAAVAAAVTLAALWRRRGRLSRRRRRPPRRREVLYGAALAAILAPLYLMAMIPAVSWDADVYHLTLPKLFLAHGGFREVPFSVYSNWPLNVELLFAAAMLVQDYVLAKLVHFGFGVLILGTLVAGCGGALRGRDAVRTSGWLAAAFFLANAVVAWEFRVAYVDLAHAFFLLAAFLFLRRALDEDRDADQALLLAGLCAGLTAGVKLTGVVGAAILATLWLPRLAAAARAGALGVAVRRFGLRFVLPVFALWLPWLAKSAWLTGNPIYPFLFGGPYWSADLSHRLQVWQSSIGMGREPLDYLLLPVRIVLAGGWGYDRFDGKLGVFWLVVLPVALWAARRRRWIRQGLWVAGLYFAFWAATSQQLRLLLPALPLAAIAAAVAVVDVVERRPRALRPAARRGVLLAGFLLALWFATDAAPGLSRSRFLAASGQALGRYLAAEGDLRESVVPPVFRFVKDHLPADARLVFLNTNKGFFCDREFLADSFFEASQIADWLRPARDVSELRELLAGKGVSHLLIEQLDWGIPYPPALFEMLQDPAQVRLLYASEGGRFRVLELLPLQPSPAAPGGGAC